MRISVIGFNTRYDNPVRLLYRILSRVRPSFVASFLKRILRIKRRVVSTEAGRFFVDPVSNFGNTVLTEPEYEPDMISALKATLGEGDTFLDVGANEGYFSVIASRLVGDSGLVVSIEPQSRLQGVLFRNIAENSAYNMHVIQSAISDGIGTATLSLAPDMNTGSSGIFRGTRYRNPTEIVPQTTLEKLLDFLKLDRIKLMKMDIESFEYEAILGSPAVFEQNRIENIALELHPSILKRRGKSESAIVGFLERNGYRRNEDHRTLVFTKNLVAR